MTSGTDELRRMLDERGVEWKAWDGTHPITVWHDETYLYEFVEYRLVNGAKQVNGCPSDNDGHCELTIKAFNCTPEQAIAATLGDTDATGERQADAGTCHDVWDVELTGRLRFQCSECGAVSLEITPNFCPVCGRKVVEPTTNDVDAEVAQ